MHPVRIGIEMNDCIVRYGCSARSKHRGCNVRDIGAIRNQDEFARSQQKSSDLSLYHLYTDNTHSRATSYSDSRRSNIETRLDKCSRCPSCIGHRGCRCKSPHRCGKSNILPTVDMIPIGIENLRKNPDAIITIGI